MSKPKPFLLAAAIALSLLPGRGNAAEPAPEPAPEPESPFTAGQLQLPGKKGIAFALREPGHPRGGTYDVNIPRIKALNVSWNYSWGANVVPGQPEDVEFIPMQWGRRGGPDQLRKHLQENVVPLIESGRVHRFLGFNEPDKQNQANMPYTLALEYWPVLEELGIPLVSPGCANPEGIDDPSAQGVRGTWMRDFMREVEERGLRVDYIGVHWYGGTNATNFKNKMRRIYEMYGERPLMITEFAPADWRTGGDITQHRQTPARVLAFMKDVLPWMEEQDWIAGYAWFPFNTTSPAGTSSALFHPDGSLTAAGRYYRSVTPDNPAGDQNG